jgi:hypothetical protein
MNAIALTWARSQSSVSILEKSILLVLASLADQDMFIEDRSQQEIATLVGCSRQSANRALANLALGGRIAIVRTADHLGAWGPCIYLLNCAEVEMSVPFAAEKVLARNRGRREAA